MASQPSSPTASLPAAVPGPTDVAGPSTGATAARPLFAPSAASPEAENPYAAWTEAALQAVTPEEVDRLYRRMLELGLTERLGTELQRIGPAAILSTKDPVVAVVLRTLAAFATLSRGQVEAADLILALPGEATTPELKLLDLSGRLYRACTDAERDPERVAAAMQELTSALSPVLDLDGELPRLARGYAGLTLGEVLLRLGDVGAARYQLEVVADEANMPPAVVVIARMLLAGIEQAVGRTDLSIGHCQVALHRATALGPTAAAQQGSPAGATQAAGSDEERLLRAILIGLLLSENRRFGIAMLADVTAGRYGPPPTGQGTVARLLGLLQLISDGPLSVNAQNELANELRWLHHRHPSAGWALLITCLLSGSLSGAGDACESYRILIQAAADLRVRYMDGIADLCDRQLSVLRNQLGPDAFEKLLDEAQRRREALRLFRRDSRPGF